MGRLLDEDAVIDVLRFGEELLKRVLDDMDVVGQDREKYSWGLGLIESYISDIEELPSAEPEHKVGHWVYRTVRGEKVPYCSECEEGTGTFYKYDYCPHCGSKMER